MIYILIIVLAFTSQITQAQELKRKTDRSGWWFKERYFVDKKTNIKQGTYRRIRTDDYSNDTLIRGQYCNNRQCGAWSYKYGHDSLVYDYTDSAVKHIPQVILACDSFYVQTEQGFVLKKVDSPPLCIDYQYQTVNTIRYKVYSPRDEAKMVASFVIDKNGGYKDITIEQSAGQYTDGSVTGAIKESLEQQKWIPAKCEGLAVDSKFFIELNFVRYSWQIPVIKNIKTYHQYIFFSLMTDKVVIY